MSRKKEQPEEIPKEEPSEQAQEQETKKKTSNLVYDLILIGGIIMLVGGVFGVARRYFDDERDKALYKELEKDFVTYEGDGENPWNIYWSTSDSAKLGAAVSWYRKCQVNFEGLKRRNGDVVAWVFFENEDISYPIVFTGDDKYIRRSIDGASSIAGTIFVDQYNNPDFEDKVTVIYGHNMRNGTMFGKLRNYKEQEDYFRDHQYFQILTEDGKAYRYRIFSYFDINEEDVEMVDIRFYDSEDPESAITEVTEVDMTSEWKEQGLTDEEIKKMEPVTETIIVNKDNTFEKYLDIIKKSNRLAKDTEVTKEDKVMCLVTCSTNQKDRLLVYGIRVDEHDFNAVEEEETSDVLLLDR